MTAAKLVALAILALPAPARGEDFLDYGTSISLGIGFVRFTNADMREHATDGVGWEGRFGFATKTNVAIELGYVGSTHELDALGLDSRAKLAGTSFELTLRFQFRAGRFEPYVVAGAGWGHYNISGTNTTTFEMMRSDDVVTYPVGPGVAVKLGDIVLDGRLVFRNVDHVDLLPTPGAGLESWSATLSIGTEY